MANLGLSWINHLASAASLAASSEVPALPVANLLADHLAVAFRAADADPLNIDFDLGAEKAIGVIGLFGLNHGAANWRILLSTTSIGNGNVLDTGTVDAGIKPGYRQAVLCPVGGVTARYGRIVLTDTSSPALDYHQIGAAWVGDLWQGPHNYQYGATPIIVDPSVVSRSRGGQTYIDVRDKYRIWEFEVPIARADLFTRAQEIDRVAGLHGNIVCVPEPGGEAEEYEAIHGRLLDLGPPARMSPNHYLKRYQIEERL